MAGLFDYTPAPKARRLAISAVFGAVVLSVLSIMGINLSTQTLSFIMLPTLVIYLWPKGANPMFSLLGITLAGFFLDLISFGPVGLWPLTWSILFLTFRPDTRSKPETFLGQWFGALIVLVCVSGAHYMFGRMLLHIPVDFKTLGLSSLTAFCLFPILYIISEYAARIFGGREDFYYERSAR